MLSLALFYFKAIITAIYPARCGKQINLTLNPNNSYTKIYPWSSPKNAGLTELQP